MTKHWRAGQKDQTKQKVRKEEKRAGTGSKGKFLNNASEKVGSLKPLNYEFGGLQEEMKK